MTTTTTVPIAEQLAELERELGYRQRVFPKWIADGRMTPDTAANRTEKLRAAIETLRSLQAAPQKAPALPLGTWPRR